MSYTDCRGLAVSTESAEALAHVDRAVTLLASYTVDPLAEIDKAIAADPGCVMAHAFKAGLLNTTTERAVLPLIEEALAAAERGLPAATPRERRHVAAARAWAQGDAPEAVRLYSDIMIEEPLDLLAIQLAHLGDFYLGHSRMLRDRVARVLPAWDEGVPGYGFVLGMHAFGLEEMGDYGRAEEEGRAALDHDRRDPWAVHAVAHVMEMQGRLGDGIAWLTGREADWAPDSMFAFHNWWHLSLYHLDRAEHARVLAIYDAHIRPQPNAVALEMVDCAALLWRLFLEGVDVGPRWSALATDWAPLARDRYYAFNDVHALMALIGAGRMADAEGVVRALREAARGPGANAMMSREVGLPVAQGLLAYGQGRDAEAIDALMAVREIAHRFGGSHAQRDVIDRTILSAARRSGRGALLRALAAERMALKPASPYNQRLMSTAEALTGTVRRAVA